jgi:hypothetical protein
LVIKGLQVLKVFKAFKDVKGPQVLLEKLVLQVLKEPRDLKEFRE